MEPYVDPGSIIVINLDRCADRFDAFRTRNAHLGPVRRLAAVDGAKVDRLDLEHRGVIATGLNYTDGALGCALSHLCLWREAAAGNRALTICEDDAVCASDFIEAANGRLAGLADDWDIVLWGWLFNSMLVFQIFPGQPAFLRHGSETPSVADFAAAPLAARSGHLFRLNRACGALCYTISPRGAARLLALCTPLRILRLEVPEAAAGWWPTIGIDILMSAFYPALNAYINIPPLAMSPNINSTTRLVVPEAVCSRTSKLPLEHLVAEIGATRPIASIEVEMYRAWMLANQGSGLMFAACFNMACAFMRADDHESAATAFRNVLALNPGFAPALNALDVMARQPADRCFMPAA
jgi:GR25 family glycosyltransferase involved in LPS biosynthesis